MENAKICQSCGVPMDGHGTNADGSQSDDYCRHCFENGKFTIPCKTVEEMIDFCAPLLARDGVFPDEDTARKHLQVNMPPLKRWKTA